MEKIKIVECPRDAMQGIKKWIPTESKLNYLQALLDVGYHTLDCGSFVSEKMVPQMRDTEEIISKLNLEKTSTKILVIVANLRGANLACNFEQIDYLGFPFSISENFQMRNTNKTIQDSFKVLKSVIELASLNKKEVVIYLSMGFGNPYGDPWSCKIVLEWVSKLVELGVKTISLSDTVGVANLTDIERIFSSLIFKFPSIEFGAHFHTTYESWFEKIDVAFDSGCRRFDTAILGKGGCPMALDELIGNMPTEKLIYFCLENGYFSGLDFEKFNFASDLSKELMKD